MRQPANSRRKYPHYQQLDEKPQADVQIIRLPCAVHYQPKADQAEEDYVRFDFPYSGHLASPPAPGGSRRTLSFAGQRAVEFEQGFLPRHVLARLGRSYHRFDYPASTKSSSVICASLIILWRVPFLS